MQCLQSEIDALCREQEEETVAIEPVNATPVEEAPLQISSNVFGRFGLAISGWWTSGKYQNGRRDEAAFHVDILSSL
jgi:hypothetical protein